MSKRTKTIYICLPITGMDEEKQRARAAELAERIRQRGFEPINPFDIGKEVQERFGGEAPSWYDYMADDIFWLLQCDGILIDFDAKDSYGCQIEIAIANAIVKSGRKPFTVYHTREQWHDVKAKYTI